MRRLILCSAAFLPLALTAACGQKGALYLPPRNGTVVTRPAGSAPGQSSNTPATTPQTTNQAAPQNTTPAQSGNKSDKDNPQTPPK